jgi:hypothetical protein
VVDKPDGTRERISGSAPTHINTKVAAEQSMLEHIERVLHPDRVPTKKGAPTFAEWFKGRFWSEHVLVRKNKSGEMREKNVIYELYLKPRFGEMPLDEITTSEVARFRAYLLSIEKPRVIARMGRNRSRNLARSAKQHPGGAVKGTEVCG